MMSVVVVVAAMRSINRSPADVTNEYVEERQRRQQETKLLVGRQQRLQSMDTRKGLD